MWFVVFILLIAADPTKIGAVLLHLVSKGLLRTTELSCNGTVGDTLRMILPKLNDAQIANQRIPADGTYEDKTIDGMAVLSADLSANRELLRKTLLE